MRYRPTPPLLLLRRLALSVENNGVRGAAVRSVRRLFRSLRNNGISGTFERAFVKAPNAPGDTWTPAVHPFDLEHGTDTGIVVSSELNTITLSGLYGTWHIGVPPSAFTEAILRLPITYEAFTFVDIGCGKGRALMVASTFPFRRLVGVEISPELCEIARANIARRPASAERISVINQDAVKFTFPNGPLLIFLADPFMERIYRRLLSSLERQLRRAPREAYLLCEGPERALQEFPFFRRIAESTHDLNPGDDENPDRRKVTFRLHRADTPA